MEEKNFPYRHEYVIYEKASHYLAVPPECLSYNGNYDDYLNQKTPVIETTQKVVTESKQRQIIDKKTKNEIKKLERTIDSLEKKIMTMEAEYPLECWKARQESWNKLVSFFGEW